MNLKVCGLKRLSCLQRGRDCLSSQKNQNQRYPPASIAVALRMKNINKFIYGNINGIQPNMRLDKSGIMQLVAKINLQTAKNFLSGQLHEWKITKRKSDKRVKKQK